MTDTLNFPAIDCREIAQDGLKSVDGYWVHHFKSVDRDFGRFLNKNGIKLNNNAFFSPREKQQLKDNWENFKLENNIGEDEDIFYYIGLKHPNSTRQLTKNEAETLIELNMWPKLCENLNNRTARAVQKQAAIIFDQYYDETDELSFQELLTLANHFHKRKKPETIYRDMKIPYYSIKWLKSINKGGKSKVYKNVLKKVGNLEKILLPLIEQQKLKKIKKLADKEINWDNIVKEMSNSEAKQIWCLTVIEICLKYQKFEENNEKDSINNEILFKCCKQEVFKWFLTNKSVLIFLKHLYSCSNIACVEFQPESFDLKKLNKKLLNQDYEHLNEAELNGEVLRIFKRIESLVRKVEDDFFKFLEPKLNVKEKIMLITEAFQRYVGKSTKWTNMFFSKLDKQIMFNVINEYYTIRYKWEPPEQFAHFIIDEKTLELLKQIWEEKNATKKKVQIKRKAKIYVHVLSGEAKPAKKQKIISEDYAESVEGSSIFSDIEETLTENGVPEKTVRFGEVTQFEGEEFEKSNEISMNETILAGNGLGPTDFDSFFNESNRSGYESLILNVPDPQPEKNEKEKNKIFTKKEVANNWLELLE